MACKYDLLFVGAGLFNAVMAYEATQKGKKCLVVEKRSHAGGNLYCEKIAGIHVHKYGAHIFHTDDKAIWKYMNKFCTFNNYINSPLARYKDELYNLPFNMNTFYRLWGTKTPKEAMHKIESLRMDIAAPSNIEEQALSLVGSEIFEKLIKGYTEKQWGCDTKDLPASILKRVPLRFTYNNNYFNDRYQGIPEGGYNGIFDKCFASCDVMLNIDFTAHRHLADMAERVIYTGTIDEYFDYCFGELSYRSLRFETFVLDIPDYQGNAVVNYTEREVPYTRIIEHKHFEFGTQPKTVITKEYPAKWQVGLEPYYPINTPENEVAYKKYLELASKQEKVIFAGRLGAYKYYDMDDTVSEALKLFNRII